MKIKNIVILPILSLIIILTLNAFSYAENIKILKIDVEYKFNKSTNTVTAIMHSNNQLANTKPTWTLSEDKLTYSKTFDSNMTYSTPAQDIYGNIVNVELKIVQVLIPEINIEYKVNPDGNITAIMKSNMELKNTKPTWVLSEDKLNYTKTFNEDITYSTPVETIYGNIIVVKIEIEKPALKITMNYEYNKKNNTVTAIMQSNLELKNTKSTWILSEDKLNYTKTFDENMIYSTPVEDIYGNIVNVHIEITKLIPKIILNYNYNANNTSVIITIKSNTEIKNTKPTWSLSSDKLNYTKIFDENMIYLTPVEDVYGNVVNVKIEITKLVPKITMEYVNNLNNTVTAIMHSNCELEDTKPTWELDKDKKTYTKVFNTNEDYFTLVQDIYGNIANVHICIHLKGDINIDTNKYPGYKELLNRLHTSHPTWDFKLLYTGLTLDEAVRGECALHSRNLVPSSYSGEWVCSVCGTRIYDSGWYCASEKAVAYYMDPRNFLDETNVFQFLDLNSYNSDSVSLSGIQTKVNGSFLHNYAEAINNACRNTNVNPYYIIARLIQEQGYSGTRIGTGMDGGDGRTYYNPFNIGASGNGYDAIYANALATAKANGWDSMQKAIEGGIAFCKRNWLENYQNTLYQNKFDIDSTNGTSLYTHQYMQNLMAAYSEARTLRSMYANTGKIDSEFTFIIPVYERMGSTSAQPSYNSETMPINVRVTANGGLNLRSDANTDSSTIRTVAQGEIVLSVQRGINSNWQKIILNDGTIGYMSGNYLQQVNDVTNCNYSAYVRTADGSGCYIRVGPSTRLDRITALTDGTWLTVINEGTYNNIDGFNWVRVLLSDGRQAFMPSKYLSR